MASGDKVERFEDLRVFQKARELTNSIYNVTSRSTFAKDRDLVRQIRRAGISIMSNIAEGFERGSNKELIQFLFIARGSCGEVRAQLIIAMDRKYIQDDEHESIRATCIEVSKMLSNFINYLKESNIKQRARIKN